MLAAILATVWHGFMIFAFGDMDRSAMRANHAIRPTLFFEEKAGGILAWDQFGELIKANRFRLGHGVSLKFGDIVLSLLWLVIHIDPFHHASEPSSRKS